MSYIIIPGGQVQIDKDWRASRYYGIDVARVEVGGTVASATMTIGAGTAQTAAISGTVIAALVPPQLLTDVGSVIPVLYQWTMSNGETDARTIYFAIVNKSA